MKKTWTLGMFAALALFFAACGGDTKTETVIEEVPAPSVAVTGDVALEVGMTTTFTATTANGEDTGYTWTSDTTGVATVDEAGVVTGVAAGTAIITATGIDTEAAGTWGIHVYVKSEEPVPTPVVMVSGPTAVKVDETITLAAETIDGEDASYTWSSSAEAVATVDAAGVVTGLTVGSATITATGADTGKAGSWNIYVWEEQEIQPPVAVVTVVGPLSALEGQTAQFIATTIDGDDSAYDWTSDNEAVATVDATGLVTALTAGEALITATGVDTDKSGIAGIVVIALDASPEIPFEDQWAASGHADAAAEAFVHWDGSDPAEIPTNCAKCHSTTGYLDFLGLDGTDFGTVDNPAPVGTVVTCAACHNSATMAMDTVSFPSGAVVAGLGAEARCMQCHQGRESTVGVDAAIEAAAPADDDAIIAGLGFKNVHYFAAGATLFGDEVKGAYQYADKLYQGRFGHEPGFDSCQGCHNPHSLEVKTESCAACHEGSVDEYRMAGSTADYDGDGTLEGIREEVEGLLELTYAALQNYAATTIGTAIVYDAGSHPYFFIDSNANGVVDEGEATSANKYATWSARLLRGAYNYQYALKDPGAFAHNGKYIIGILYETIADLGGDVSGLARFDSGHFNASSEAFRHWDSAGEVQASCGRCHSGEGFKYYAMNGQDSANAVPVTNGLSCNVCHVGTDYANGAPRRYVATVTFPSGNVINNDSANPDDSFMCMSCHQGRESKTSVDAGIAAGSFGFKNVHYAPAGAVLYGSVAGVGYEYEGKTYAGQFTHYSGTSAQCAACHNIEGEGHTFEPEFKASCQGCHNEAGGNLAGIRKNRSTDYDGDGNTTEPLADELAALADLMYAEMQAYATAAGSGILYDGGAYPYFFKDTNGNGLVDAGEATNANKYTAWNADLMRAAFNLQFYKKEAGAWAHNTDYMAQLLFDTIEALGGDVSGLNRP